MTAESQVRQSCLKSNDVGDVTVVTFAVHRILGEQNIQVIGEQLFNLVNARGRKKIVISFRGVEYLSVAAAGKMMMLEKKLKVIKGILVPCDLHPDLYEFFEITKLDNYFTIVKDEQQALDLCA